MATNTLIQKLYGADEIDSTESTYNADSLLASQSNRRQLETFIAGEAIVANEVVMVTPATSSGANQLMRVKKCGADALGNARAVGVALHAAASGERVEVVIGGYAMAKSDGGAITAGLRLIATQHGGNGAVSLEPNQAAGTKINFIFGVALDDKDGDDNVNLWVFNRF